MPLPAGSGPIRERPTAHPHGGAPAHPRDSMVHLATAAVPERGALAPQYVVVKKSIFPFDGHDSART
jgi:hypothetical protein